MFVAYSHLHPGGCDGTFAHSLSVARSTRVFRVTYDRHFWVWVGRKVLSIQPRARARAQTAAIPLLKKGARAS